MGEARMNGIFYDMLYDKVQLATTVVLRTKFDICDPTLDFVCRSHRRTTVRRKKKMGMTKRG